MWSSMFSRVIMEVVKTELYKSQYGNVAMTGMQSLWNTPILDQMAGTNTASEPTSSTRKNIYSPMSKSENEIYCF